MIESMKKFYVVNIKGFDIDNMTAVTLLFEGSDELVNF